MSSRRHGWTLSKSWISYLNEKEDDVLKVRIDLQVVFDTPFTVGIGSSTGSLADKPLYRDALGRPVIPGSSLKGKARHRCEQILRGLTGMPHSACRSPNPETMCPRDSVRLNKGEFGYCPICQIFGGPSYPAALFFSDLHWEYAAQWEEMMAPSLVRSSVSIRRSRRVAEPDRLFTTETFATGPETIFLGAITGNLPDEDQARYSLIALLVAGLRQTRALGGGRSRGLGHCRIIPTVAEIMEDDDEPLVFDVSEQDLRRALLSWTK